MVRAADGARIPGDRPRAELPGLGRRGPRPRRRRGRHALPARRRHRRGARAPSRASSTRRSASAASPACAPTATAPLPFDHWVLEANDATAVVIQIETAGALNARLRDRRREGRATSSSSGPTTSRRPSASPATTTSRATAPPSSASAPSRGSTARPPASCCARPTRSRRCAALGYTVFTTSDRSLLPQSAARLARGSGRAGLDAVRYRYYGLPARPAPGAPDLAGARQALPAARPPDGRRRRGGAPLDEVPPGARHDRPGHRPRGVPQGAPEERDGRGPRRAARAFGRRRAAHPPLRARGDLHVADQGGLRLPRRPALGRRAASCCPRRAPYEFGDNPSRDRRRPHDRQRRAPRRRRHRAARPTTSRSTRRST